jgi:cation:H+ antiporter
VVFFIYSDLPYVISLGPLEVGIDSLILIATYVAGMRQVRRQSLSLLPAEPGELADGELPSMRVSVFWFVAATAVLVVVTPWLVDSAGQIAELTGLGTTFVGATLVAFVTSMPELVTTTSAARIGADDMAIGNLFGSNAFNMVVIGVADLFLLRSHLMGTISDSLLLVGMLGLLMTLMGWIGNLARIEKRLGLLEVDASLLIVVYFAGLALLYSRGLAP